MYDALTIAKYIITYESTQNRFVSNLRLQKLLYFIQAQFLVTYGTPCFSDKMEAWNFGPVIPNVYHKYKIFGSGSIPASLCKNYSDISDADCDMIDQILDSCAQYSTTALVRITHNQTPWKEAYNNYDNTIYAPAIKSFFGG